MEKKKKSVSKLTSDNDCLKTFSVGGFVIKNKEGRTIAKGIRKDGGITHNWMLLLLLLLLLFLIQILLILLLRLLFLIPIMPNLLCFLLPQMWVILQYGLEELATLIKMP